MSRKRSSDYELRDLSVNVQSFVTTEGRASKQCMDFVVPFGFRYEQRSLFPVKYPFKRLQPKTPPFQQVFCVKALQCLETH